MEWPASLALGLQRRLTEPNVSDPLLLLAQFRERHQLLSWPFLDVYFPQQPGLLLALVLAGLLLALLSVLALVLLLARFFGACEHRFYNVSSEAPPKSRFSSLLALVSLDWLFLCLCTVLLGHFILALGNNQMALASEDAVVLRADNKSSADKFVSISLKAITILNRRLKQPSRFGETDVLNKYNNIRELGYEFRALESAADYDVQVVSLVMIVFAFAVLLLLLLGAVSVGAREHWHRPAHLERSTSSNYCGRACSVAAGVLLLLAPCVLCAGILLLAYTQVHGVVCPYVQMTAQNQDIEDYVNANFIYFDPYNLLDFLNDLTAERADLNQLSCESFARPLQGAWLCLWMLAAGAFAGALALFPLANFFLRPRAKLGGLGVHDLYGPVTEKALHHLQYGHTLAPPRY